MANRTIKIYGFNHTAGTAITATWNGTEVFNGTLSTSVMSFSDHYTDNTTAPSELLEFTFANADDTAESEHALNLTVTAGECSVGEIYVISHNENTIYDNFIEDESGRGKPPCTSIGGKWYWNPGNMGVYADGSDPADNSMPEKKAITINGSAPDLPGYTGSADGTLTYASIGMHLTTNDVYACTSRVPAILVAGTGYWSL